VSEERYNAAAEAESYIWEREKRYTLNLKRLYDFFDNLWAVSVGAMFSRQREIARDDLECELERLSPDGKWAAENGKRKKKKNPYKGYPGSDYDTGIA